MLSFQLYISDTQGPLQANQLYTVTLYDLRSRLQTRALINSRLALVDYLVTMDTGLDMSGLHGDLYVGGYRDVTELKVGRYHRYMPGYIITLDIMMV